MEPWFANTVNFLMIGEMPKRWNKDDRVHFSLMVSFLMRDDLYLNIVQTKSLEEACPMIKFKVFTLS